jgi:hypothetical protein
MAPIALEEIARRLYDTKPVCLPRYKLAAYALAHQRPCSCSYLCTQKRDRMFRTVDMWGPKAVREVTRQMMRERARRHWDLVRRKVTR